ncbi:hypothetical protein AVEN_172429-1 [Araneus ventricosus]|uniref:Uncharacterized protein n=1 Tax=Araneus ventricosus TaxID=182803 RepID=A0A4Y2R563_ARAVE|nr:hypothetical protein AVEN_172429-1 [Araneus ventricosus]
MVFLIATITPPPRLQEMVEESRSFRKTRYRSSKRSDESICSHSQVSVKQIISKSSEATELKKINSFSTKTTDILIKNRESIAVSGMSISDSRVRRKIGIVWINLIFFQSTKEFSNQTTLSPNRCTR